MSYLKHLIALVFIIGTMATATHMLGAFGKEKEANEKVQGIADKVRMEVAREWDKLCKRENIVGGEFEEYEVVSYKSQIVAGTNYIMKVRINPAHCIVIKVYEPLPYSQAPVQLKGIRPYEGGEIDYSMFS